MPDIKSYKLTNKQPGPRGFSSAANGFVMIDPEADTVATLTKDEFELIDSYGAFDIEEAALGNSGEITGSQSVNLPASGQIDRHAPVDTVDAQTGKDTTKQTEKAAARAGEANQPDKAKAKTEAKS